MFNDLKKLTSILETKNEENEGLKTELVRLQDNEEKITQMDKETARLRE